MVLWLLTGYGIIAWATIIILRALAEHDIEGSNRPSWPGPLGRSSGEHWVIAMTFGVLWGLLPFYILAVSIAAVTAQAARWLSGQSWFKKFVEWS